MTIAGAPDTGDLAGEHGYLLDNRQAEAGARFAALSALFDHVTFAHLERTGVGPGWQCWEVGAGSDSVPGWLAARVEPGGGVLATDLDLAWLPAGAPYSTARHELGVDPVPEAAYDLVHARLVLVHVTARERALADLVASLRPGGWLVVEEADPSLQPLACPDEQGEAEALANRLKSGFRELMAARGVDLAYGRTLPRRFRDAGLERVGADAYFPVASPACTALEIATTEQVRGRLVSAGCATEEDVAEHLANLAAGALDVATSPLVSAWGRRPEREPAR